MNAYLVDKTPRPNKPKSKPVNIPVNPKLFDQIINGIAQPSEPDTRASKIPEPVNLPRRTYYHYDDIRQHAMQLPCSYTAAEYRKAFAPNANYYGIRRVLAEVGRLQKRGQS